jgi:ATP-binding cassette subfamily B protein/subfamily B ATP-binding cassette protein MsbA
LKRSWETLRRILPYLRPYWKLAVLALLLTLLAALFSLLLPWPLAIMFDSVIGGNPLPAILEPLFGSLGRVQLLVLLAVGAVALTAMQGIFGVLEQYITAKIDQYMTLEFRSDLFRHAQRLSFAYHDQRRTGNFVAQINLQASSAGNLIVAIPPILQSIATLVGMLVVALSISVKLTLLVASVVPFIYYSTGHYVKRIEPRLVKVRGMEGESLSIVHEAMAMLRVIVPFGLESHHYERFREQGERAVAARVDLTVRQTAFSVIVNVLTAIGTALVLGFGAYQILRGELEGGRLLVMMAYTAAVYQPLEQMSSTVSSLQEQFVNVRGALDLRDAQVEVEDAPDAIDIDRARGDVAFEGVDFSYQRRVDTLKDISFQARAGQRVAIVGPTGAGKTTLISMLPRFYDRARGRILLDGIDIRKLTLKSLRRQISIVLQEPLLFSGTIAENIRYGRLGASTEEVVEAAKDANAHDFIMRLPDKYETRLGERGAQLSGGERQRISIARAFLKDAPICILDEPTSSIDSRTEAVILESLERLMVGRTTFMIAHRLSTVRNANLILVLNHGRLIEQGIHDDLLGREGLYQQLHAAQTGQVQHRERLERFERLELAVQEASVSAGHEADNAHQGDGNARPDPRHAGVPGSSAEGTSRLTSTRQPGDTPESVGATHRSEADGRGEGPQGGSERTRSLRRYLLPRIAILGAVIAAGFWVGWIIASGLGS